MNFKGILDWIKGLVNIPVKMYNHIPGEVKALAEVSLKPRPQRDPHNRNNKVYLNDPSTPQFIIEEPEPIPVFPMHAMGEAGGGYPIGTIQQQALALKQMVNSALVYMKSKTPKEVKGWAATGSLTLIPRAGKDVNAFYDRSALQFFYFGDPVVRKNVFSADARSVVVHEFGHAYLDILRPDWWDTQCAEIWAFHEAFGDMTAILATLEYDALIEEAIRETNGDLMKSNIISRLAAEMGVGLYHVVQQQQPETEVNPTCLRDMSQSWDYAPPETLPENGGDSMLINECHSFSRIFSHAFYEILISVAQFNVSEHSVSLKDGVKMARDTMASCLFEAVLAAPTAVRAFDAIARHMICVNPKYSQIMSSIFEKHNMLINQVSALADVDMKTFVDGIEEPHEVRTKGKTKIVKTLGTKTMKLSDKLGLMALSDNPLLDVEITVPCQSAYYFENDKLINSSEFNEAEMLDAAYNCLDILHKQNLVGKHKEAIFDVKHGKLVRTQIICTCGKPNYCDPNAPEYGKPWKPANNAGCSKCYSKNCLPQSCSCESEAPSPPPKLGCYTTVKIGGQTAYKFGSSASRKFC